LWGNIPGALSRSLVDVVPDDTVVPQAQYRSTNRVFVLAGDVSVGKVQSQPAAIGKGIAKHIPTQAIEHPSIIENNGVVELAAHRAHQMLVAGVKI